MIYLKQIKLTDPMLVEGPAEELKYPYRAAAVRHLESVVFNKPVTFVVGENGIGKSTLLEAIMNKYEAHDEGKEGMMNDGREGLKMYANVLPDNIRLIETARADEHFFFRAESFFEFAREIDNRSFEDIRKYGRDYTAKRFGGRRLLEQSHGESFLNTFLHYGGRNMFYILDEPEAALSPQRQLALLVRIKELVSNNCQLIISTHSPILMAYPGADIYLIDDDGARLTSYEETEHYQITRYFLTHTDQMLRELLG
jgi:predicted ATPase